MHIDELVPVPRHIAVRYEPPEKHRVKLEYCSHQTWRRKRILPDQVLLARYRQQPEHQLRPTEENDGRSHREHDELYASSHRAAKAYPVSRSRSGSVEMTDNCLRCGRRAREHMSSPPYRPVQPGSIFMLGLAGRWSRALEPDYRRPGGQNTCYCALWWRSRPSWPSVSASQRDKVQNAARSALMAIMHLPSRKAATLPASDG